MIDWIPWTTGPEAERWAAYYEQALACGLSPGLTAEDERLLRPLELLAMAAQRLPAAALVLPALLLCEDRDERGARVRAEARRLAAQVVRLIVRTLQVHARDAGYRPGEWIAAGVARAELSAFDAGDPFVTVEHLEDAARSIAAAISAENDLMAVPEHLGSALGAGLALYASVTDGPRT